MVNGNKVSAVSKNKSSSNPINSHSDTNDTNYIKALMFGASPAQKNQLTMIRNVFTNMDIDNDGILSIGDVKAYFGSVGRNSSDGEVRKWIAARDIDQDGAVSLAEFIASYTLQLDPNSQSADRNGKLTTVKNEVSPVAIAFGTVKLASTVQETLMACDAAIEYSMRILDSPNVKIFWSIPLKDETFNKKIGRLFGGIKLMLSLGFQLESNGSVLALNDNEGKEWSTVPSKVRQELVKRVDELKSHRSSLSEPQISNIAAGIS